MSHQTYLYGIDFKKITKSKAKIIEIFNTHISEIDDIEDYTEARKIDIAKLDEPIKFSVEELTSLIEVFKLYYFKINRNGNSQQSIADIGITLLLETFGSKDSSLLMDCFKLLFPNLPDSYNENSVYYPLVKYDLIQFLENISEEHLLLSFVSKLRDSSFIISINSSDDDIYLLIDSY